MEIVKAEVWLRPNCRILLLVLVPAVALAGAGVAVISLVSSLMGQLVGWGLLGIAILAVLMAINHLRKPRIAYLDGKVLFYLRSRKPVAVPVEIVEAFFVGQGPADVPGNFNRNAESMNLVARLSQNRVEWAKVQVKPSLGSWCDGYVTIRGTWCEPITSELVRHLNRRLREVTQAAKTTTTK